MSDTLLAGCETVVRRTAASTVVSCVLVVDTTNPNAVLWDDGTPSLWDDGTTMEWAA